MSETESESVSEETTPAPWWRGVAISALAWLVPGAGHLAVGRPRRAAAFAFIVLAAVVMGYGLEGKLFRVVDGQPLSVLGTLGSMGAGLPYVVLRYVLGFEGDVTDPGYEYGTAFLLTAGLMNFLLVFDVWDLAQGRKS